MPIDPALLWISTLVPAAVLAAAAWEKLRAPQEFRAIVSAYALLPSGMVAPVAFALPFLELALAAALILPASRMVAAAGAIALLVVFAAAIAVNLQRGRTQIDCGCHFGGSRTQLSAALLLRNGLLILWTLPALGAEPLARALGWLDWVTIAVASGAGVMAYAIAGTLLATQQRMKPLGSGSAR